MNRLLTRLLVRLAFRTPVGRFAWVAVAGMFLVYTLATALTQVRPGERAVVRRFGRILSEKPRPGLHVGWPWGIDQVERVPVGKIRRVEVGFSGKESDEATATPAGQLL